MSILVVGLSHKMASVAMLERAALTDEQVTKLVTDAASSAHVAEAVVVATCNRLELYADVERFHAGVDEVTELLSRHTGIPSAELTPTLYVRYEDGAAAHLFSVVCGLDSMVVGETQILGQVKAALRTAQELRVVGPTLNALFQHALRVGKRAHTETDLGRAGRSLVGAALDRARGVLGALSGRRALVVGAGSMAALAATTLHRDHRAQLTIANRTPERARRLAAETGGEAVGLDGMADRLAGADIVVSCTGASDIVLTHDQVRAARPSGATERPSRPLVVIDLAMPHDVDRTVAELPDVTLIDLARLSESGVDGRADVVAVRTVVAEGVEEFLSARRANAAAPAVVALRTMAAEVVEAELRRLVGRVPDLAPATRAEVEKTVRRVVDKLLHAPTVRVKELAGQSVQASYADALRELFALDPATAAVLEAGIPEEPVEESDRR